MWLLGLQIGAVLVAPLLDRLAGSVTPISERVHQLFSWVVIAVVLAHVVPEGWHAAGGVSLLVLVWGFFMAWCLERLTGRHQGLIATGAAMAFHHLFDGFALGQPSHAELLAPGIVLHTFPVALLAWRLASERSASAGVTMLIALISATSLGFLLAQSTAAPTERTAALFACFVAGWLAQTLGHGHGDDVRSADDSHERPAAYAARAEGSASTSESL